MLQAKTSTGGSILSEAVASGSTTATKTVIEEMGKYLKRDQVYSKRIGSGGHKAGYAKSTRARRIHSFMALDKNTGKDVLSTRRRTRSFLCFRSQANIGLSSLTIMCASNRPDVIDGSRR